MSAPDMRALAFGLFGLALAAPLLAGPYAYGPPEGHTGGFGEPTCRRCHAGNALNDRDGVLRLDGVPDTYVAGRHYRLEVLVARSGARRGGFQLAARFADGDRRGSQAGELAVQRETVEIVQAQNSQVVYAQHSDRGSYGAEPDTLRWEVDWIAPPGALGPVVFHVSAVASNDDDSELGDFIYTLTLMSGS